jgi:hypothetical protein
MKRKMFSIMAIAAIALTSCKKEEPASNELGEATIEGTIMADLNLDNNVLEPVVGMQVTVIVNTQNWDQTPVAGYDYEKRTYTATTDAAGKYTLTIPATAEAYTVTVEYGDMYSTRTGGIIIPSENVIVSLGDNTVSIYDGAAIIISEEADVDAVSTQGDQYGTATVYGYINVTYDIANWNVAPAPNQRMTTASGINEPVVWRFESAPYNANDEAVYEVAVDLTDGSYEITFPTEALTGNYSYYDWGILDFIGSRKQNNWNATADSTVAGVWSCGGIEYYDGWGYIDGDLNTNMNINLSFSPF